ncbi:MAG: tetratricopeptide repeat protein [Methyloligellaceae bacterium]
MHLICYRLVMLCLLSLLLLGSVTPSRADDAGECTKARSDASIRDCSRIIESGQLYGKPLDKVGLAIIHYSRGMAYRYRQQHDRAIADFSETIELFPKFALAFDRRGTAYAKLKQYDRAISDFGQFIRLDPNTSLGFFNRGTAYMDVKEYDRAIADFSQGIKLNPKSTFGFISRGGAYVELKQYDRAIADYREALKLDPSSEDSKAGLRRLGVGD